MICKLCICFYCILCTCKQTVCARSICIYCLSKWILQPSLLSTGQERKSWAPSSCSGTRLWHFHADDWFRCGEKREEVSGFGLCPLITLYYHTGGIYHQTPKASVHGGTLKPISSLTCNPSRSTKSSTAECYHIHFLCKSGMFPWKTKKQRTERKRGVWNPWKPLSCIFFYPIQCHSLVWCGSHSRCTHASTSASISVSNYIDWRIGSGTGKMMKYIHAVFHYEHCKQ